MGSSYPAAAADAPRRTYYWVISITLRFQYDTLLHVLSATKLRLLLRVLYEHSDSPWGNGVIPANCRLIPVPRVLAREQGRTLRSGQVGRGPRGAEPRPVPTQL